MLLKEKKNGKHSDFKVQRLVIFFWEFLPAVNAFKNQIKTFNEKFKILLQYKMNHKNSFQDTLSKGSKFTKER